VTEEGCQPGVSVCLISGTGSVVREVEGVFSVFSQQQQGATPMHPKGEKRGAAVLRSILTSRISGTALSVPGSTRFLWRNS